MELCLWNSKNFATNLEGRNLFCESLNIWLNIWAELIFVSGNIYEIFGRSLVSGCLQHLQCRYLASLYLIFRRSQVVGSQNFTYIYIYIFFTQMSKHCIKNSDGVKWILETMLHSIEKNMSDAKRPSVLKSDLYWLFASILNSSSWHRLQNARRSWYYFKQIIGINYFCSNFFSWLKIFSYFLFSIVSQLRRGTILGCIKVIFCKYEQ